MAVVGGSGGGKWRQLCWKNNKKERKKRSNPVRNMSVNMIYLGPSKSLDMGMELGSWVQIYLSF